MEMNYTKGEWELQRPYIDKNIVIVAGKQRSKRGVIAEIYQTKEQLANAQLIASAPDMYEALDAIIVHFRKLDKLYSKDLEMLNMGSKALAKAEGK